VALLLDAMGPFAYFPSRGKESVEIPFSCFGFRLLIIFYRDAKKPIIRFGFGSAPVATRSKMGMGFWIVASSPFLVRSSAGEAATW